MLIVAERFVLRIANGKDELVGETAELGGALGLGGLRERLYSAFGG